MISFIERLDVNYPIILDVITHRSIARSQSSDFHAGLDILDEFLPLLSDSKSNTEFKLPWLAFFTDKSESTPPTSDQKTDDNKFRSFLDSINPIELMKSSNSNSGSNRIPIVRDTRTKHNATPNNNDKPSIPQSTLSNSIAPLPLENSTVNNSNQPNTNSDPNGEPELYIDSEDEDDAPRPQRVDIVPPQRFTGLANDGEYPLHRAVYVGNHELVCTLLKQGFSAASIDIHGFIFLLNPINVKQILLGPYYILQYFAYCRQHATPYCFHDWLHW